MKPFHFQGWQYRWFVLEPSTGFLIIIPYLLSNLFKLIPGGMLEYYLLEDRSGKCRGSNHMGEATVSPSQDDENTFTINFVSGDHYKVSAR